MWGPAPAHTPAAPKLSEPEQPQHGGPEDRNARHCLSYEGSGNTRRRQCRTADAHRDPVAHQAGKAAATTYTNLRARASASARARA